MIDETYSFDPLSYTVEAFLSEYNLTAEEAAKQPWFANKKVRRHDGRAEQWDNP